MKRILYLLWIVLIGAFAVLHALHLTADFPNHTPWLHDWAKYTDEGWYGNAAVRAHLFGSWYVRQDFNPAVALPVWPLLEWLLFFATGVSIAAARGLAIACFFANLGLSYVLLRSAAKRWVALLALTLIVTSPFLYCFSRLAILEPLLTTFTLAALSIAVGLAKRRQPIVAAFSVGVLFALMMLTKTTAVFLLPGVMWAMVRSLWPDRRRALRCLIAAAGASALVYGLWMALVVRAGLLVDFKYLFTINSYIKPHERWWMVMSLWWSFHGGLWIDHLLIPLAGVMFLGAVASVRFGWGRGLMMDPVFGSSVLAVAGYVLFMTVQNHPQPRYFAVVAVFCMFIVALGAGRLCEEAGVLQRLGWGGVCLAISAAILNATWTLGYVLHPEYTLIEATQALARYVETHPNGKPLLVATSGDQITLMSHLRSLDDDFGTVPLHDKIATYQPGWFATWNDLDPGALADLHTRYSVEQVATFSALDDPERQRLVLFKLHQWADGRVRDQVDENLNVPLPGDRIEIELR
ncbi:MAG TPA: glycosyltransferase family 39 protein [Terracidiphilus sp.]|jgi:hypothetical protein|nr:glycosyltransferase family 39 protein [Terracidiphilus sp.]